MGEKVGSFFHMGQAFRLGGNLAPSRRVKLAVMQSGRAEGNSNKCSATSNFGVGSYRLGSGGEVGHKRTNSGRYFLPIFSNAFFAAARILIKATFLPDF
jgi:hypothetical protein